MANYAIPNGQVKASTEYDGNHAAIQGRLHYKAIPGKAGSWSARTNDVNQWLQVDLGNEFTRVTGVASQGRNAYNQWVTKYKLQYSNDGVHFQYYWEQGQGAEKVKRNFIKLSKHLIRLILAPSLCICHNKVISFQRNL